ncbi:hypothetical protein J2X68_003234 [Streptomyces sp. 3330]|uniref:hypothetical protein n=1 Tax=Streptomyces sp. 3330 TaxID=2817755 RepID=UPI00286004A9|nr:hypothetical protein [Streptomyces sp. 3330]MDR6976543.1 hypothetical protein [Streptomyces sp. 3330]
MHRYVRALYEVLPRHAKQILTENAWSALTAALAAAEVAGHNPATVLQQAAQHRPLDDAKSASEVLVWRIQRLGDRHAPGPGARAAQARRLPAQTAPQTDPGLPGAYTPPTSHAGRSR